MKIMIFIIGMLLVVWGGIHFALGLAGDTAVALDVKMRRFGGERDEAIANRYSYSISYDFITRNGHRVSGHSESVGNAFTADAPSRICYFTAAPYINAPAEKCGFCGHSITLSGTGLLIMWPAGWRQWCAGGRKVSAKQPSRKPRKRSKQTGLAARPYHGALSGAEAHAWVSRYRGHARRYTWIFFTFVVLGIGSIVRWELGEFSREWFMATSFAALLTWLLTYSMRRKVESSWTGKLVAKEVVERPRPRSDNEISLSYFAIFETPRGRRIRYRITAALFDFYMEGSVYGKFAGLQYPVPLKVGNETGLCPVCGKPYKDADTHCAACHAPVLDLGHIEK